MMFTEIRYCNVFLFEKRGVVLRLGGGGGGLGHASLACLKFF